MRRTAKRLRIDRTSTRKKFGDLPQRGRPFVVIVGDPRPISNYNTLLHHSRFSIEADVRSFLIFASILEFDIAFVYRFTRTTCFHSRQSAYITRSKGAYKRSFRITSDANLELWRLPSPQASLRLADAPPFSRSLGLPHHTARTQALLQTQPRAGDILQCCQCPQGV